MSESQYIEATDIVIEPTRALSEIDESISSSNKILDNLNFTKKQLRNVILEFDQCLSAINNLEGKTIIEKDGSQYIIEYGDITINHIADQRKISRPAITGKFKKGSNNWYKAKYLMSNSDFVLKYRKVIEKISPLRTLYYDLIESSEGSHKML